MLIRHVTAAAISLAALGGGLVAGSPPATAAASSKPCAVVPVTPKVIILSHKVERRTFVLRTTCKLAAPLTLRSSAGSAIADTFTWPGNGRGVLGDEAKYTWSRKLVDLAWIGTLRVRSQVVKLAGSTATTRTTPVAYTLEFKQESKQAGIYSQDAGDTFSPDPPLGWGAVSRS